MERIAFLVERTGERLSGLLNPESVVMRRTSGVHVRQSSGGPLTGARLSDDPLLYTGGGVTELTLDLLFDVTLAGSSTTTEDVRVLTRPLWQLSENTEGDDGLRRPPLVRFVWGKAWNVLGVVSAVAERLEYFTPSGTPQRSWLRLRLQRVDEGSPSPASSEPAEMSVPHVASATDFAPEELQVHEVLGAGGDDEGRGGAAERLDEIAYREYGDPAYWRVLAAVNDVPDPLRVRRGQRLVVPTRTALEAKR